MPKTIIAANWKVNKTVEESFQFIDRFKQNLADPGQVEVVICPPFTAIRSVWEKVKKTPIKIGAQTIFWQDNCAFTGEISPRMAKEAGCDYAIVGHSERREHFGETDWIVNKKLVAGLNEGLKMILCVGETARDRKYKLSLSVIDTQLRKGLSGITPNKIKGLVIAYEPVWAIGTGVNASPEQAQEVHEFIRKTINELYTTEIAVNISILYGGSVKVGNIKLLMGEKDVNGALIGGASLDPDTFSQIMEIVKKEG